MEKQYPPSKGYVAERNTPESRREEIGKWSGDRWYPVLLDLDADLTEMVPDYSLQQVKEKFGDLRYYVSTEGLDPTVVEQMRSRITAAELECLRLDTHG